MKHQRSEYAVRYQGELCICVRERHRHESNALTAPRGATSEALIFGEILG